MSPTAPEQKYPDWRVEELARKYTDPHEWDFALDGDGEIDDVELEDAVDEETP